MTSVSLYNGDVTLEFNEAKHVYTWKEVGKPVRGVTTILKWLNKPALISWAANMAAFHVRDNYEEGMTGSDIAALCDEARSAHRKFSKSAADIGTEAHAFCEAFLTAKMQRSAEPNIPENPAVAKACAAFLDWYAAHDIRTIALEHILFSKRHYFAGTCDFYGLIDGKLCALDFKTSSGIYPEMIIQVNGAYAMALEEMYGERVEQSWIIRLDKKTGKFEAHQMNRSDEDQTAFRVLLEVDYHMKRLDEKVKELKS